ncbi:PP2C family protein-serine/threonine phosphatase [Methylobacter sp.]|uniref:PP2C family protein-serine/threonine phosphatase n=1 Tax=Methylobacter sp. TaxID=2051955 RepID=UPI003DA23749
MDLDVHQLTLVGDREVNQDFMAYIVDDAYALFVMADGLGGHLAGNKASRFFCEGMLRFAKAYSGLLARNPNPSTMISLWITDAVNEMKQLFGQDSDVEQACTTCAILYIDKWFVLTAHCGDTRIYRMNPQQILWRTQDHSVVQELIDQGEIAEQEMAQHPCQNQLTRCINALRAHEAEIRLYPAMEKGETFVLCSDGFWGKVKQHELLQLAQLDSGEAELSKLVQLAMLRGNGKSDNVTAQLIRCL